MAVEYVEARRLKPADYNPRRMSDKERADLTESMKRFGFAEPIVVNRHKGREFVVVGGHQRLAIAKALKIDPIPCVFVDLPLKRERELNVRLNKNLGDWDWDALANFDLDELLDFGFDRVEVDARMNVDEPKPVTGEKGGPTHVCPKCGFEF